MESADRASGFWMRELLRHHEGVMLIGDRATPVKYVIDAGAGALFAPVERWMLDFDSATIFLPEEKNDALQVGVMMDYAAPRGLEAADRWSIYHGKAREDRWCWMRLLGARMGERVADAEDFSLANPVQALEPKLCRRVNSMKDRLREACAKKAGVAVAEPLCVGIDAMGMDVRAAFGIVRLEFEESTAGIGAHSTEADRVVASIERLLGASIEMQA